MTDPEHTLDTDAGSDGPSVNRRALLATAAGLGAVSLAGCSAEEGDGSDIPPRPQGGDINVDQLDPVLEFLVRSTDYQNRVLEQEFGSGGGGDGGGE